MMAGGIERVKGVNFSYFLSYLAVEVRSRTSLPKGVATGWLQPESGGRRGRKRRDNWCLFPRSFSSPRKKKKKRKKKSPRKSIDLFGIDLFGGGGEELFQHQSSRSPPPVKHFFSSLILLAQCRGVQHGT